MSNELIELSDETLATVNGGDGACTVAAGGTAAAVGFALAALGVATAGWGALAGTMMFVSCSAGADGQLGQVSDIQGA